MTTFATEFPIERVPERGAFLAQVIAWLRGTRYSTVLDEGREADLARETAYLRSSNGEVLHFRELERDGTLEAIGFRHDFPDDDGRLWRTESVICGAAANERHNIIRFRTQCIARVHGAHLAVPRKPYLVKSIIHDGWPGYDGSIKVDDQPLWLADDERALLFAREIALGSASLHLPTVYISSTGSLHWALEKHQIEKLAYDLGGVAHVVVEPDRTFSFRLRDATDGCNVYGGTVGIAVPGRATVRRFYLGWRLQTGSDLLNALRSALLEMRTQMPASGWDWTELQEQALQRQRERDRNRLTFQETEQLYLQEIANLRDRNKQLEGQISEHQITQQTYDGSEDLVSETLTTRIGPQIYPGEFLDRLRLSVWIARKFADQVGLDSRSKAVFDAISANTSSSPALSELLEDIKRAAKDPKRSASEFRAVLLRHGYVEKAEKKHIRLEPIEGYRGLGAITLAKTPSDNRSPKNTKKQIENTLGLTKLSN